MAITPVWALPGDPDIRGTYGGAGTVTLSSCTTVAFNGPHGLTATIEIPVQIGQDFSGVVTGGLSSLPLPVSVSAGLGGVVAPDGQLAGTFNFVIAAVGLPVGAGSGTFTGQAQDDLVTLNLSGQVETPGGVAANCALTGSVTASRTPSSFTVLAAAVLPSSRSVQIGAAATAGVTAQVGGIATAFATIINGGARKGLGCRIAPITGVPADFTFWTTDQATNQVTGNANAAADIEIGQSQAFLIAFAPTGEFPPTEVQLSFECLNAPSAQVIPGVNTLLLSASLTPVTDIVAVVLTPSFDGIVNIPGTTGTGFFAAASINLGASASVTVTTDTGGVPLPVEVSLCQTDSGANCISTLGPSVVTQINGGDTSTFSIFVKGNGLIAPNAATNRIFLLFKVGAVTSGSASVAAQTAQ